MFGHCAHLQVDVGIRDGIGPDSQTGLRERLKSADLNREVVVAGGNVNNDIVAGVISVRSTRNAGGTVGDNHMRLRHGRAGLVRHRTRYRAVQNLSASTVRVSQCQETESKQTSQMNTPSTSKHGLAPFL